jgi:hypothetical protein
MLLPVSERQAGQIKELILSESRSKYFKNFMQQLNLFLDEGGGF